MSGTRGEPRGAVAAPAFVPSRGSTSIVEEAALSAKPFVPGRSGAVNAKPFVPGGGRAGLPQSSSTTSLGSVNAPVFVPGGASTSGRAPLIDAKPFVPSGQAGAGAAGSTAASSRPPHQCESMTGDAGGLRSVLLHKQCWHGSDPLG